MLQCVKLMFHKLVPLPTSNVWDRLSYFLLIVSERCRFLGVNGDYN
jgi:hypothetical protein